MKNEFLPFAKPSISPEAIAEVVDSLKSGWITTGPKVKKFEQMLAEYVSVKYISCLSSATAGLHLALLALDIGPGDEVITTPMTFVATLNVIEMVGATVKLVDVNRGTYNINEKELEKAITKKTKAIMPVHFAGAPVDLTTIYNIAKKYNLRVIEDAAHAIGTEFNNKKIGAFGDIQVFSFHPNKNMTTGEGGAVACNDKKIIDKINLLKFHGMDREAWNRFGKTGSPHYQIVCAGYKYNMMDIQAALGIHQLPALDTFIEKRTKLVSRYYKKLENLKYLILPKTPKYIHKHAWHLFAPTVDMRISPISRDELLEKLKEYNIGTGIHFEAVHLYPYYTKKYGFKKGDFPNAENIGENILSLPLFPDLTFTQQDTVIEVLYEIFKQER